MLLVSIGIFLGFTGANGFKTEGGKYYVTYKSHKREVPEKKYYRLKIIKNFLDISVVITFSALGIAGYIVHKREEAEKENQPPETANDSGGAPTP